MERVAVCPCPEAFTVGWLCALPIERAAAEHMLDFEYKNPNLQSSYTLGRIGHHNVVIACLPAGIIGTASAASVASQMQSDFNSLRIRLMVGIGGGVPSDETDVRLGDVAISQPTNGHGGVVQYDFGKTKSDGRLERTGFLNAPPKELLDTLSKFRARDHSGRSGFLSHLATFSKLATFDRVQAGSDILFRSDSQHVSGASCEQCDAKMVLERHIRSNPDPIVHYGTIASANQVIRDGVTRDRLGTELGGVLCFEMEAAGLMNAFPCLVLRGICDYCDQHKNKSWQPFAAATAAACAKELLLLSPSAFEETSSSPEQWSEIRRWLAAPDPHMNFARALDQRQAGTGLWFTAGDKYTEWKISSSSKLWLHGIPGCGKTILASTVIADLLHDASMDSSISIAYFFFDFRDAQKLKSKLMVRSLLTQLSRNHVKVPKDLSTAYTSGKSAPSSKQLQESLRQVMQQLSATYIVLDALDECGDREELVQCLEKMSGWQLQGLHLLVTSRRDHDIEFKLNAFVSHEYQVLLQTQLVDADIQEYVHHRLCTDKRLQKWRKDPEICQKIKRVLGEGANGMFRWAACQLDSLAKYRNRKMLHRGLATLPQTLEATYDRILTDINEADIPYAVRILQWLSFSFRPLLIEEIAEAVAIDINREPMFDRDEVLEEPREVLEICSSLVTIENMPEREAVRASSSRLRNRTIVALAHFSVKKYLLSDHVGSIRSGIFSLPHSRIHESLAMSCLGYLLQYNDPTSFIPNASNARLALSQYCVGYWKSHAKEAGQGTDRLQHCMLRFLMEDPWCCFG